MRGLIPRLGDELGLLVEPHRARRLGGGGAHGGYHVGADRGSSKLASSSPIFLRAVAHRALFWTGRMGPAPPAPKRLSARLLRGIKKGDAVASPSKVVEVEERMF